MTTKSAAAPIALALALALGGCGKSGTDANAVAANETVLNDETLLSNDAATNLVDESTLGSAAVDNGTVGDDAGGNGAIGNTL